ncbi:hypothetical protein MRX96_041348 [Rhipicephalus microplus]
MRRHGRGAQAPDARDDFRWMPAGRRPAIFLCASLIVVLPPSTHYSLVDVDVVGVVVAPSVLFLPRRCPYTDFRGKERLSFRVFFHSALAEYRARFSRLAEPRV